MGPKTLLARDAGSKPAEPIDSIPSRLSPTALAEIVEEFASQTDQWIERVRLRADRRWYERLYYGSDFDIWVISWLPGQSTGFHDHGASSGAFVVATGFLEEHRPGEVSRPVCAGQSLAFGPDYAHDVGNVSLAPAVSIHAYSPPLEEMNEYELDGDRLVPRDGLQPSASPDDQPWGIETQTLARGSGTKSIDQVLAAARARLHRLSPESAYEAVSSAGAVLVDIRPAAQRALEGTIPGALVVERNVLEWRFDPNSSAKLPVATDHQLQVIIFCSEGYTSSLAAASLQNLGLWRATDMAGGFQAWCEAGLPVAAPKMTQS